MAGLYIFQLCEIVEYRTTLMLVAGIVLTGATYLYMAVYKRHLAAILKENVLLTAFVAQGLIWCGLSLAGMAGWFSLSGTYGVDLGYLPRQAYYLFFLPLISVSAFFERNRLLPWIKAHNLECFALLYGFYAIVNRTIFVETDPATALFLGALVLAGMPRLQDKGNYQIEWKKITLRGWLQPIFLIVLLALPNTEYGTSCTILLKVLVAAIFLVRFRKLLLLGAALCIPLFLAVSFVLPQIPNVSAHLQDRNSIFRIECWQDAERTIGETFGLGIGYGTTYASDEFIHAQPVFQEDTNTWEHVAGDDTIWNEYLDNGKHEETEQIYVTANHNSFVSVALRTGILGLFLFCGVFVQLWRKLSKGLSLSAAAVFLYCGGLFCIMVNVGLESPAYFVPFLTAMCTVSYLTAENGKAKETDIVCDK